MTPFCRDEDKPNGGVINPIDFAMSLDVAFFQPAFENEIHTADEFYSTTSTPDNSLDSTMLLVSEMRPQDIPPPPSVHWMKRLPRSHMRLPVISIGSSGHPETCKGTCANVAKGLECKFGVNCTRCHVCTTPWDALESSNGPVKSPSIGTEGHPYTCGGACKYVKRKGGCRDGVDCLKCHRCFWSTNMPHELKSTGEFTSQDVNSDQLADESTGQDVSLGLTADAVEPALLEKDVHVIDMPVKIHINKTVPTWGITLQVASTDLPSSGSLGHPLSCGLPCKYHRKPKGCKDAAACIRCHLCLWAGTGKKIAGQRKSSTESGTQKQGRFRTLGLMPTQSMPTYMSVTEHCFSL